MIYRLTALWRFDEQVKAYVGYVPLLGVYTQARTKERLQPALNSAASLFIRACAEKKMLWSVLRMQGAKKIDDRTVEQCLADDKLEFISVPGYEELAESIEVPVPISLLAQQEALSA
jgi:hypothetical protein